MTYRVAMNDLHYSLTVQRETEYKNLAFSVLLVKILKIYTADKDS